MGDFIFRISPNVVLGSYTASRLGQFALDYGSKYMVVLDPVLKEVGLSEKILQPLTDHNISYFVFDDIPPVADTQVVEQALKLARDAHVHGIIVAGGSHVINVGRAICAMYNENNDIYSYIDKTVDVNSLSSPLPLICVPTTMRDLFVFTDQLPLVDSRNKRINLLKVQNGLCKLVLFDPNLSVTLTENQIESLSLEILCVAIEAYISQKATFFSDMFIEKALEQLSYALNGSSTLTVTTPKELLLSQGGMLTSLAVATSSIGTASLLSLCINSRYNILRSLVTGILFPYLIEDSAKYKLDKIAKVARILNYASSENTAEECVEALTSNIRQIMAKVHLPTRLKELSVSIEQLSLAVEDAGNLDLINNLPRSMNTDDLFDLIKQAY